MRMPEMQLEPVAINDRRYDEAPEDEDRIHELLAWVHRRTEGGAV